MALHEVRCRSPDRHDKVELAPRNKRANILDERAFLLRVLDPRRVEEDLVEIDRLPRCPDKFSAEAPGHVAPRRIGVTERVDEQDTPRFSGRDCYVRQHQESYAP